MKKVKVLIMALFVMGMAAATSSCTQKTCPTYAKQDVQEINADSRS